MPEAPVDTTVTQTLVSFSMLAPVVGKLPTALFPLKQLKGTLPFSMRDDQFFETIAKPGRLKIIPFNGLIEFMGSELRIPVISTPDSTRWRHPVPVDADTLWAACI